MNKKIENLVKKCSVFEPLDGRVLIHPLKLRTYESVQQEPDLDSEENKGKNPMEDELVMKRKVYDVNYNYQKAIVVQIGPNEQKLNIGDTIIYKVSNLIDFDVIKGISMLKGFEVIAIERTDDDKHKGATTGRVLHEPKPEYYEGEVEEEIESMEERVEWLKSNGYSVMEDTTSN